MCIIALPVDSVGETQIFVAPDSTKKKQITVYSNVVDNNEESNAMILPVPYPNTIQLIDLSNYKDIFQDCKASFDIHNMTRSLGVSKSMYKSFDCDGPTKLEVHTVGGYSASIAMNLADLKRVDTTVFRLDDGCAELLQKDYSNPKYGFIICKLEKGQKEYHPFAYSHDLDDGNTMFIPTKHYHGHVNTHTDTQTQMDSKSKEQSQLHKMLFPEMHTDDEKEAFDHDIYIYNGRPQENSPHFKTDRQHLFDYILNNDAPKNIQKIRSKLQFDIGEKESFLKYKIEGKYENIDLRSIVV